MRKLMIPMLACVVAVLGVPGAAASFLQAAPRVTGELKAPAAVAPGKTFNLSIVLKVQNGWKITAGKDSGDELPDSWPTTITVEPPSGWTTGKLKWPKAKEFDVAGLKATGYSGTVTIEAPITPGSGAAPGEHPIQVAINYQACDANICEMPTDLALSAQVNVGESGEAPTTVTTPPIDEEPAENGDDLGTSSTADKEFFGIPVPSAEGLIGVLLVIVLAMVGGFLLNLTPCVLPVIPIKIMTISSHAGTPGRSLALGLAMAAGVVAFWVAIGIPAAIFVEAADPSRIFGIWYITLGIGLVIGLMGIGIMGLFTIQLPQAVYSINPKAETAWGSFVFGVMTAVLGLPCFGFVAGALLAGSATLPPATIIAIFTSLGIGMAAPYLVLSAKPGLLHKIPRTGPASELVKQIMGLLLLAAAAYFIGSGLIALVVEKPYMARLLHWWAVALLTALAGLWLIVRTFQITNAAGKRIAFTLVGVVIGGAAIIVAVDITHKARTTTWKEYSPAAFETARAEGDIVVLDFTAEWCINCKALKAAVLNRNPVRDELAKDDVTKLMVDLTSTTAPGWDYLRELGQTGIPLLVIYTPGKDQPWQSNAYTSTQVLEALEEARSTRVSMDEEERLWLDYTPEAFEAAQNSGKVAVLYFDAEWAIGCSLPNWRQVVLNKDPVRRELLRPDVATFAVDVTTTQAPGWDLLQQLGQYGIPHLFIFAANNNEPWSASAFTPDEVVQALNNARSAQVARH